MHEELETPVKLAVYGATSSTGTVPRIADVARDLQIDEAAVRGAFAALRERRLLVLEDDGEIRMAPPFSALPVGHVVRAGGIDYQANCIWDAYGIAAALGTDAELRSDCGDCGEALELQVRDGEAVPARAIFHYAVPAAHWWDDIVYT